jgi:hypothetical protein
VVKATADEGLEARKPPESGCQTPQHPTTQTAFNCPSWRVVLVNSDVRQQRARQTQLAPEPGWGTGNQTPGSLHGAALKREWLARQLGGAEARIVLHGLSPGSHKPYIHTYIHTYIVD